MKETGVGGEGSKGDSQGPEVWGQPQDPNRGKREVVRKKQETRGRGEKTETESVEETSSGDSRREMA